MTDKILFVDDEKDVLKSLLRLFMDEPYEVFTFDAPSRALKEMKTTEFAAVISDQRMPLMEGTEFLQKVREKRPDTVRIILTGYADLEAAVDAINKGNVYSFINKPWDEATLLHTVRNAVDHYNLTAENRRLFEVTRKQNEELASLNKNLERLVDIRTKKIKRLLDEVEDGFHRIIHVFTELMELFDSQLGGHAKRVARLSKEIAEQYEMGEKDIELIELSALLHDIGLIGIPRELLEKNEQDLKKHEKGLIRQHPEIGLSLIKGIVGLKDAGMLVKCHHENMDGSGYPAGLKNDEIPLGARIIRLADAYDRMVNRNGISPENAISSLKMRSSRAYDPGVLSRLVDMYGNFEKIAEDEIPVLLHDLKSGMVLTRPIETASGRLLLPEDKEISELLIQKIRQFNEVDPIVDTIFVDRAGV